MLIMAIPGIVEDWEGTRGEGQVDRLQHWRWKKCERWSSIIVSAAKFQLYVQILDPWTRMKRVCWFLSVPHWSWQIQEEGLGEPGSTWYFVLGTWYLVLGTWQYLVPECPWRIQARAIPRRESRTARRGNWLAPSKCSSSFSFSMSPRSNLLKFMFNERYSWWDWKSKCTAQNKSMFGNNNNK